MKIPSLKTSISILFLLCLFLTVPFRTVHAAENTQSAAASAVTIPQAQDVPPAAMHAFMQEIIHTACGGSENEAAMTQAQKLRACYDFVMNYLTYQRNTAAGNGLLAEDYCLQACYTGRGNCYRYACMFGYLAQELGYNVRIASGCCTSSKGGWTPHSWCEIMQPDGTWLVYDLSFGDSNRNRSFYGITAAQHTRKLRPDEYWTLTY